MKNFTTKTICKRVSLLMVFISLIACLPVKATVRYVTKTGIVLGNQQGDGLSWANGTDMLRALNNAVAGDEIWVKTGTYVVGISILGPAEPQYWTMKSGVKIYGGFSGTTETSLNQRDPVSNPVAFSSRSSSSNYILYYGSANSETLLDGVTVQGATRYTAIMVNGGMPVFQNVTIKNCTNTETGFGGGMSVNGANPILKNITFQNNTAFAQGGAVYIQNSVPVFNKVIFQGNSSPTDGGAVYSIQSAPSFNNVVFQNNQCTDGLGGAVNIYYDGSNNAKATFRNAVFYNNKSVNGIGGAVYCQISNPSFFNCSFVNNSCGTDESGGAIHTWAPASNALVTSTITNCAFFNNLCNTAYFPKVCDIATFRNGRSTVTFSYFKETNVFSNASNRPTNGNPFADTSKPAGADGIWMNCDDGLMASSGEIIDKGNNSGVDTLTKDITGMERRYDVTSITDAPGQTAPVVDMGAYESRIPSNIALLTGTIGNAHTIPYPQELFPDYIKSLTPPGAGMSIVRWEKKEGSGSWTPAGGLSPTDSAGLRLPTIVPTEFPYTVYYRRVATGAAVCNVEYFTDPVAIKVVNAQGTLSGYVKSRNGTTPVQGDTIQLRRLSPSLSGSPDNMTYYAVTGNQGQYSFPSVYYGDPSVPSSSARFRITPIRTGHTFSPAIDTVFRNNRYVLDNINFTDSTGYSINGETSQQCDNCILDYRTPQIIGVISCPLDSVDIWKAEGSQPSIKITQSGYISPSFGRYGFVAENPGSLKVEAKFANHVFSSSPRTITLTTDVADLDFRDVTTHTISGRFTAGCGNYIGKAVLEFTDILPKDANNNPRTSCFIKRVETEAGTGNFSITLPARKYKVKVISFTPAITDQNDPAYIYPTDLTSFFGIQLPADSITRDITLKDTVLNLMYQRKPVLEVSGPRINYVCSKPFGIWPQLAKDSFFVKAYQGPVNLRCPLYDTNKIHIFTNIQGDAANQEILAPVTDTGYWVKLKGGNPNIIAPYYKTLNVQFTDRYGNVVRSVDNGITIDGISKNIVVTGLKQNEAAFHTVSPQIPMLILHDPPGDNSSSYWQQSQSSKTSMKTYASTGVGGSLWTEIKVGAKFEKGIAFITESEVWGSIESELRVDATHKTSNQTELTMTALQNISTSNAPASIGNDGDVYMGMAMNLICAKAIEISYNTSACAVETNTRLAMANEGFSTQYVYSELHIKNTLIPNLIRDADTLRKTRLRADSLTADSLSNQANVWQTVLNNNKANRDAAAFEKNISFDGGIGEYKSSTSITRSKSNTIEYSMLLDATLAYGMGLYEAGNGGAGKVKVNFKSEWGGDITNTNTTETTTGYTMKDVDDKDYFTVDVKKDLVYGTPVFEMKAGVASCPKEAKAQPRDEVKLSIPVPAQTNVQANTQAQFILKIRNTSQSEETRTYLLSFDQASNPDGAVVTINGSPVVAPFSYTIPYRQETQVTVRVANVSSTVYSYHNLRFIVTGDCNGNSNVRDSGTISVDFQSPCSNITLAAPVNDWVLNAGANNILSTLLTKYDVSGLTKVVLQYAKKGVSTWSDGYTKLASELNPNGNNGQIVDWNISNLPDDFYNLRVQLICGQGVTIYSETRPGVIDRTAPILLGNPTPANNSYVNGDIISFNYNEKLLTGLNGLQVTMERLSNNAVIPITVSGYENKIVITPVNPITGLVGETIRVVVNGIADQYGNLRTRPDTSYFVIGVSPVNVGNRALIVTSTNTRLYKNADTTINVFFKLPVNATDSMRVNYTIGGTARLGIDYTVNYVNAQPAYAFFNGAQGAICIRKNTNSAWLKIRPIGDTSLSPDKTVIISLSEGGDYVMGSTTSVADTLTSEDGVLYYTFTGTGNFTDKINWEYGKMPLPTLASGKTIYINPIDSCILNVPLTIRPGAALRVVQGKRFIIPGSLKLN